MGDTTLIVECTLLSNPRRRSGGRIREGRIMTMGGELGVSRHSLDIGSY